MQNFLLPVSVLCLVILLLIFILKRFRHPYTVAYILAGILLGPHVSALFSEPHTVEGLGEIGILLLMFFLGVEIGIPNSKSLLRESIYAGALLSQTGEFGILACSLAYQMEIIPGEVFKACIAVTALSLLISSVWMSVVRKYVYGGVSGVRLRYK